MKSRRELILTALTALLLAPSVGAMAETAPADKPLKVVFQVSDSDPAKWNLALNNARNVQQDLGSDKVAVEIVAYGPGIGMLKMDSVAGPRVAEAVASGTSVVACENTMRNQNHARGHAPEDQLRRGRRRAIDAAAERGLRLHSTLNRLAPAWKSLRDRSHHSRRLPALTHRAAAAPHRPTRATPARSGPSRCTHR